MVARNDVPAAERAVARDAPSTSHGASVERQMRQDDQDYLNALVNNGPFISEVLSGTVISIDARRKRCVVGTQTLYGDGGRLDSVCYGDISPVVGGSYPVRISSDPNQIEHWIKVRGSKPRWLYFRPALAGPPSQPQPIWRLRWPITEDRVPEVVGTVDVSAVIGTGFSNGGLLRLFGYHTGTRQLYLLNQQSSGFDYFPATAPPAWQTWLAMLPDWGFDSASQTSQNTDGQITVMGVLDDTQTDTTMVGIVAIAPVNTTVTWNSGIGQPDTIDAPLFVAVQEGAGNGALWTTAQTVEYMRTIDSPPPNVGTHVGLPIRPDSWPLMQEPLGGLIYQHHAPGLVLSAATVGIPAGTRVWPLPSAAFDGAPTNPFAESANVTYTPTLSLLVSGGGLVTVPFTPPFGFWGGDSSVEQTPVPLWVRQGSDGNWVVYALLQVGAPEGVGIFVGAPTRWYRGTGALGALVWKPIGVVIPVGVALDTTVPNPGQILAISVDGQSLVAWTPGTDNDGWPHRVMSDDYGETWAELPATSTLLSDAVDETFDDLLLVDIPDGDIRAEAQT